MNPRTYESLSAASERTNISVKTLRRFIAEGNLRAYRVGKRILRVDPKGVDSIMRPVPTA